jgi:hypothetical protein
MDLLHCALSAADWTKKLSFIKCKSAAQECIGNTTTPKVVSLCLSLSLLLSPSLSLPHSLFVYLSLHHSVFVSLPLSFSLCVLCLNLSLPPSLSFSIYTYISIHIFTFRAGPSLGSREIAMLKYLSASLE